ncbi:hypothetical protein DAPPUDRAFT_321115 [Daphnia pulex]|uniref:Uncharacterized protein n=1 Tax=Daphnia pulex TaxID=6669 RepID=E9GRY9_DAPPU|nr:hypothetical protein DAPPUDRAFT_321115 [Daphnia pulex]|eukprot:EFX77615.1 hypothetical protein DAPPUDRAFT_321115 [Daphnia pulex]
MITGCFPSSKSSVDEYLILTTATIPQLYVLKAVEVCYRKAFYRSQFTATSSELSESFLHVVSSLPLCSIYLKLIIALFLLLIMIVIDLLIDHSLLEITILLFRLIHIAAVQLDPLVKRRKDIS